MTYLIKKDNKTFEKYSFFDFMMLSTLCVLIFKTPEKSNDSWYLPNGKILSGIFSNVVHSFHSQRRIQRPLKHLRSCFSQK